MEKIISSNENKLVKDTAKLKDKEARTENGEFLIEGSKLIEEAIAGNIKINCIFIDTGSTGKFSDLIDKSEELNIRIYPVTDNVLKKVSDFVTPQGLVAVAQLPKTPDIKDIKKDGKYIALEEIQDPGNVGTIIRTAEASGLDGVIIDKSCADIYSLKVVRGSMGSVFRLPVYIVDNLAATVKSLKNRGLAVYAAMASPNGVEAQNAFKKGKGYVVVIGNEGAGIKQDTISACDNCVFIPMKGETESLNAATAAAIIMWEMTK